MNAPPNRWLFYLAMAHLGCTLIATLSPTTAIRFLIGMIWMLGPAANLIHGLQSINVFFVGTVLLALLAVLRAKSERLSRRRWLAWAVVVCWLLFGTIAYAPGA